MREGAHTLSDFRVPTLSIECEACGRPKGEVARMVQAIRKVVVFILAIAMLVVGLYASYSVRS